MRNLMVNRGTLLLINRLCQMDVGDDINRHEGLKQLMIKHTMKAIIGYGDALLYAQNRYHWSYREKHTRVLHSHGISQAFLDAYDRAMKFRFFPDYEPFANIDIPQWQAQTRRILGELHLYCESVRLEDSALTWTEYLDRGLASLATERGFSAKTIAKASLNLLKSHTGKLPRDSSLSARLGYHLSSRDEVLPVLFPLLAYCSDEGEQAAEHMAFVQTHFGASANDLRSLISAYLIQWGQAFDPNLRHVLAKNGINL